jgi:NADPH-dependent 2,4-dienoyl-CoA reductase/sulfur reductase-like enzyme
MDMNSRRYDLIVVGGGPAGMAAAVGAATGGLRKILLLERLPRLGGVLNQCIHLGFGLTYFKEEMTGTEYAARYKKMVHERDIEAMTSCFVHKITPQREITFVCADGEFTVSAKHIVMATGCRERTREMLTVPGTRPAGIFTAGLAQEMVNIYGVMPGKEVVVIGSGDIGLIMARRMTLEGAKVHAVLEILDHLSGLIRNKVQCLDDFGIPLYLQHELLEIIGRDRVEVQEQQDRGAKDPSLRYGAVLRRAHTGARPLDRCGHQTWKWDTSRGERRLHSRLCGCGNQGSGKTGDVIEVS